MDTLHLQKSRKPLLKYFILSLFTSLIGTALSGLSPWLHRRFHVAQAAMSSPSAACRIYCNLYSPHWGPRSICGSGSSPTGGRSPLHFLVTD